MDFLNNCSIVFLERPGFQQIWPGRFLLSWLKKKLIVQFDNKWPQLVFNKDNN